MSTLAANVPAEQEGVEMNQDSESPKQTTAFMRFEYISGSLDAKTRELVLLSATAVAGCTH